MNDKPLTPQEIAQLLNLSPLDQEGGMFRRTWESRELWQNKAAGSSIYFLLTANSFSHLHRLPSDEVYHFYLGDPVELTLLGPDGEVKKITLGRDLRAGQVPQAVAPAGWWQGSRLLPDGQYALLGTTMSPGYVDEDYEHGDAAHLKTLYPSASEVIDRLTGEAIYL